MLSYVSVRVWGRSRREKLNYDFYNPKKVPSIIFFFFFSFMSGILDFPLLFFVIYETIFFQFDFRKSLESNIFQYYRYHSFKVYCYVTLRFRISVKATIKNYFSSN